MPRWSMRVLLCIVAPCRASFLINADAGASYAVKMQKGVEQALQWMAEMTVLGQLPRREPREVKAALVGLGRTGSTSLAMALKQLGYVTMHDAKASEASDVYRDLMTGAMSLDQANTELGRRGFDIPWGSTHRYVEWLATRPDIKVILTVRDKKRWAESFRSLAPVALLFDWRPYCWLKITQDIAAFNREVMLNVPTNGHPELYQDLPTLEAGFQAWVDFVRRTIPQERLLEFDVKEGWEPLCSFLQQPVSSEPFPHVNDRAVVDVVVKVFVAIAWIWPLLLASSLFLLWRCCCRCCHRRVVDESKKRA